MSEKKLKVHQVPINLTLTSPPLTMFLSTTTLNQSNHSALNACHVLCAKFDVHLEKRHACLVNVYCPCSLGVHVFTIEQPI